MVYQKKIYKGKSKGIKKELTVKWLVANKKIIKFIEEEEKTYKLANNVIEFLDEIKANTPVNVTVIGDSVTFIQKRDEVISEEPEQEAETNDEPQEEIADEMIYTVKAISKTRDYYLFDEANEKEWFTVAPNVKSYLENVKKGDVLKVNIKITNDGKRDVKTIVFAQIQTVEKTNEQKIEEKTSTFTRKSSYRDEESTDKRTAIMIAKDIINTLLANDKIKKNEIKSVLVDLSKISYEIIKKL